MFISRKYTPLDGYMAEVLPRHFTNTLIFYYTLIIVKQGATVDGLSPTRQYKLLETTNPSPNERVLTCSTRHKLRETREMPT